MAQLKATSVAGNLSVTGNVIATDLILSASKTARHVFAAPASNGAPSFRALEAADIGSGTFDAARIPNLAASKITSGTLAVACGGTNIGSYTIGDILYASAATTLSKLTGNTTTTRKFLRSVATTNGTAVAPAWDTIASGDLPVATASAIGGVKIGTNIGVSSGTISVATATTSALGVMKVGTGLSVSSGTVSVAYGTKASTALQGNQTLFTLNNAAKTASSTASFYAPTGAGTAGQVLVSAGGTNAPTWTDYPKCIQRKDFTIAKNTSSIALTNDAFTADSYVLSIVVTSGEANLPSAISWTSAASKITLSITAKAADAIAGYILVARGQTL